VLVHGKHSVFVGGCGQKNRKNRLAALVLQRVVYSFSILAAKISALVSTKGKPAPLRVSLLVSQEGFLEPAFLTSPFKETEK
jgi:hypothetical protein